MPTEAQALPDLNGASRSTLKDVAAIAGTSIKTASRALSGEPGVHKATQAKIEAAAKKLNYKPNKLAQQLRAGNRTHAIALLVGELSNPFYSSIASGIEGVLQDKGFDLLIASTDENSDQEEHLIEGFIERSVEGFMVVTSSSNHFHLESERQRGTPLVFIDRPPTNLLADSVTLDNKAAVKLALDYLFKHGCRKIAVLADSENVWTAAQRLDAFGEYFLDNNLVFDKSLVFVSQANQELAASTTERLLRQGSADRPDAILATNNQICIGVVAGMKRAKSSIPLVGIDDFDFAELLSITTVTNNPVELGKKAAEIVLHRLGRPQSDPMHLEITPELVERSLVPEIPGLRLAD